MANKLKQRFLNKNLLYGRTFSKTAIVAFAIIFACVGGYIIVYKSFSAPNPNLAGDLNNDNVVNIYDLSILLTNYSTANVNADINNDGIVNIFDLSILLSHYGQTYSSPTTPYPPPPQTSGTTYYVSPNGSDSNAGNNVNTPFKTIQQAANVVNPGDTVIVEDGTYTSSSTPLINVGRGGTATNFVWFKSRNVGGAKLDGRNNAILEGFRFDTGIANVRIEGFEIYGFGGSGGGGIDLYAGGSNVQIINNHIHDIGRLCLDSVYGQDAIFTRMPDTLIEGNLIHDIGRYGPNENGCAANPQNYPDHDHGVYASGDSLGANRLMVRNNIFYNINRGWSVQLYPGTLTGVNILNNTFVFPNPYKDGQIIIADNLSNSLVADNIFFQPKTTAINTSSAGTVSGVTLSNNTNTTGSMVSGPTSGITLQDNKVSTDPLFVSTILSSLDFHLQMGSPAKDVVTTPLVQRDYDGYNRPRGASGDIGAYEQ